VAVYEAHTIGIEYIIFLRTISIILKVTPILKEHNKSMNLPFSIYYRGATKVKTLSKMLTQGPRLIDCRTFELPHCGNTCFCEGWGLHLQTKHTYMHKLDEDISILLFLSSYLIRAEGDRLSKGPHFLHPCSPTGWTEIRSKTKTKTKNKKQKNKKNQALFLNYFRQVLQKANHVSFIIVGRFFYFIFGKNIKKSHKLQRYLQ
jgi:hypothetical protein